MRENVEKEKGETRGKERLVQEWMLVTTIELR